MAHAGRSNAMPASNIVAETTPALAAAMLRETIVCSCVMICAPVTSETLPCSTATPACAASPSIVKVKPVRKALQVFSVSPTLPHSRVGSECRPRITSNPSRTPARERRHRTQHPDHSRVRSMRSTACADAADISAMADTANSLVRLCDKLSRLALQPRTRPENLGYRAENRANILCGLSSVLNGLNAAVRSLAFNWIRTLFRCWQRRIPYDETLYLNALQRRGSPLIQNFTQ